QVMAGMGRKAEDLEAVMADVQKSDPRTISTAFYELLTLDLRPQLAQIHAPLLVIAAGDSSTHATITPQVWHAQLDAVPHVDLQVVEGAKHFVMLDAPDKFYALVDGFLAKAP